jgi:D-glycero-D-manno-heptose 1,7-bisphosphate phosphatase
LTRRPEITKSLENVVFLDRDGVINADSPDYIKSWVEFRFLPGSLDAIRQLTQNGFAVVVITNQSAVGRGMISLETLYDIHRRMCREIATAGGKITDIFYCPHRPDGGCDCRKPMPGMILKAAQAYDIDLSTAWMIGDSAKDIECGLNAGCRGTILVKTGNGNAAQKYFRDKGVSPNAIAENLSDALEYIIM